MEIRNAETFYWVNLKGRSRVGEIGWMIILWRGGGRMITAENTDPERRKR
jgi:hypothetical protein